MMRETVDRLNREILICALLTTACAPVIHPRLATFNEAEYKQYAGEGTATIHGEAFLKTRGGDVKKAAGNPVYLNPVTTYSTEWYERAILAGEPLELADPRAIPFHRKTIADSEGRFEFTGLPAGEYYLACSIVWETPHQNMFNPYDVYLVPTGGMAHGRAKVAPGERVKIILTR